MSNNTTNYNLIKPTDDEDADISVINGNMDLIDIKLKYLEDGKESSLKNATEKTAFSDADTIPLCDSATSKETKKITYSNIKAGLETYFDTLYNKTTIANNLTTTTAGNALDATQGKALADSISAVNTTLTNQSKSQNINISSATQTLYGVDNVDLALQKIAPKTEQIVRFTSSQTWTVPNNVFEADIYIVGGGYNGGNGSGGDNGNIPGGAGGAGGKILYIPKYKVTPNSTLSVIIGASNGGESSFGLLASVDSDYYQATDANITAYLKYKGATSQRCPIDGNVYGIAGAKGGSAYSGTSNNINIFAGGSVTLTGKTGGTDSGVVATWSGGSGGGASANTNGSNGTAQSRDSSYGGNGGSANANTGNGGGGGGAATSTSSHNGGIGGSGGSGIVIIRYYS